MDLLESFAGFIALRLVLSLFARRRVRILRIVTDSKTQPVSRAQRILAYMVAGAVGLSILAFLAVIVGTAAGMKGDSFSQGVWPTILLLPLFGLPIGFVLIISLLIVTLVTRSHAARSNSEARGNAGARGNAKARSGS